MRVVRASAVAVSIVALFLSGPTVNAKDKEKTPGRITVSFGTGNNNARPDQNPPPGPNHHIIPMEFKVRINKVKNLEGQVVTVPAVVNFVVAGFHWPWVYVPGVTVQEVQAHLPPFPPVSNLFINYEVVTNGVSNVLAKGVDPTAANPAPLSNAQNRVESFAFSKPGKYLVICNVNPHFRDGMFAWITVVDDDDDN
jgi:hypothetical protein